MNIRRCKCGKHNIYTNRKICQVCEYLDADLSHLETCVDCGDKIRTFTLGRRCEHCKSERFQGLSLWIIALIHRFWGEVPRHFLTNKRVMKNTRERVPKHFNHAPRRPK
jgi:hypothetical protein